MGDFQGEGQEKILLCKGGVHYMKKKNIGCQLNLVSKKGPYAKMHKKILNIEKFFLAHFAHSAFYKIRISGAANRHAPVQYAKYVLFFCCCCCCCCFLNSHHDTNPFTSFVSFSLKKYNYILANIYGESSRVIFSFFLSSSSGSNILYPSKFCNHLKRSAK